MKRLLLLGCASLALIAATANAQARVTRIEITKQEPFAAGQAFGNVGAYEKVVGRFRGELDPTSPLNAVIVDLDKAPRNARGMVEYSADFYILKPVDVTKGNGALFYELANRGVVLRADAEGGLHDHIDPRSCARFRISGGRSFVRLDLSSNSISHICRNPIRLWHHGPRVFLQHFTANDALTHLDIGILTAIRTTVSIGGMEVVSSGGTTSGALLSGGQETVLRGGHATGTLISSGGYELVSSGGTAVATHIIGGTLEVESGGTASGIVFSSGGT